MPAHPTLATAGQSVIVVGWFGFSGINDDGISDQFLGFLSVLGWHNLVDRLVGRHALGVKREARNLDSINVHCFAN